MLLRRQILTALLLLGLSGGHWAFLQTVAWTDMLLRYSAVEGWAKGVWMTFSGEAPCPLCEKVASGSQDEKRPSSFQYATKFELFAVGAEVQLPQPPWLRWQPLAGRFTAPFRQDSPPDPPPIIA